MVDGIENLTIAEIDLNNPNQGNNQQNPEPIDPTKQKGPEGPTAFDESNWLKENFGEGITKDVIKERLNNQSAPVDPELLTIAENIKKEPNVKALVNYIAGGGRDIPFFHDLINTDVAAMSSFDKVLKQAILNNKDKSLTPQVIESALRSKYNMLEDPRNSGLGREYSDIEKNEGLFRLSQDATAAEEFIVNLQNSAKLTAPEQKQQQMAVTETERIKLWEPEFGKGMGKITVPNKVTIGDVTLEEAFEYELSAEEQQQYNDLFKQNVKSYQGLELNEKNLATLRGFTNKIFAGALMEKITSLAYSRGAVSGAKALAAKYGGIDLGKENSNQPDKGGEKQVVIQDVNTGNGGNSQNYW